MRRYCTVKENNIGRVFSETFATDRKTFLLYIIGERKKMNLKMFLIMTINNVSMYDQYEHQGYKDAAHFFTSR